MDTKTAPIPKSAPASATEAQTLLLRARGVIDVEIEALEGIKSRLDKGFEQSIGLIEAATNPSTGGRVIVTGMGKSGLIGKKIAATLSSTGTPAYFLHPAEGSHGDLGLVSKNDVVLAISNSGETPEILGILPLIKRLGLPMIAMTGKPASTLGQQSEAILDISVVREACPLTLAPTASTTATLAMGDALAVVLLERKNFTPDDFALFHPAGALGKRLLLRVSDLMHTGEALPVIPLETPFMDALLTMTEKKLGMVILLNATGSMTGILTDGDVRRALMKYPDTRSIVVSEVMTQSPKTIDSAALAVSALRVMEECKITVLVVLNAEQQPQGVVHMHDILKTGIS